MKTKPKGILFDLGDTILKVNRFDIVSGYIHILQSLSPGILNDRNIIADTVTDVETFLKPFKEDSILQYRTEYIQKLIIGLLGKEAVWSSNNFELELWKLATQFIPESGIELVLSFLKSENVALGIVSNSSFSGSVLEWELKQHNLCSFFSFVISSADYGIRKPHPYLFKIGLNRLGLNNSDVWFVGDKKEYDIQGALDSNIHPIWYNRQGNKSKDEPTYHEINSWLEFIDLYNES